MRLFPLFLIGCLVHAAPAQAQKADPTTQLRSLLQKKYGNLKTQNKKPAPRSGIRGLRSSPTRSLRPASPSEAKPAEARKPVKKDFYVVTPDGKVKESPSVKTDRRSEAQPAANAGATVVSDETASNGGDFIGFLRSLIAPAHDLPGAVRADVGGSQTEESQERIRIAQGTRGAVRKGGSLAVKKDVFIIQFKPSTTEQQIDQLISKYNLTVRDVNWDLGVLYVSSERPPATRSIGGATRSASPAAPAAKSKPETLGGLLEPDVLKKIRKEPVVNAAAVHSTISPKALPRPSETSVNVDKRAYHWSWRPDATNDGNWGLKRLRLPPVWQVLKTVRAGENPGKVPVMGFLDIGFGWHGHLQYNLIHGLKPGEKPFSPSATCQDSHGTHVAGIAGAAHGRGRGIDGIVPDAKVDAIPLTADLFFVGVDAGILGGDAANQRAVLFMDALSTLVRYLKENPVEEGRKRVINVSLGFNWSAAGAQIANGDLVESSPKTHVLMLAQMLHQSLQSFQDDTLFIVAAGNDSEDLDKPLNAKWASPFAYLGLGGLGSARTAPNVLVVEAVDRSGQRAAFSNVGGHVAAPGVEVMSTLSGRRDVYGICDGTSQAAPHVTAVAAILMELAPQLSPSDVATVIRESSVPVTEGDVAPRVDALSAMLRARPNAVRILADLNGDGEVDGDDLATFRRHKVAMTTVFRSTLGSYFFDLNLNGRVEDNEHWFPRIDLNGSGAAVDGKTDVRCVNGKPTTDLDIVARAWTGATPFAKLAKKLGLTGNASQAANRPASALISSRMTARAVARSSNNAGAEAAAQVNCKW